MDFSLSSLSEGLPNIEKQNQGLVLLDEKIMSSFIKQLTIKRCQKSLPGKIFRQKR
jgi:hypothetical protein